MSIDKQALRDVAGKANTDNHTQVEWFQYLRCSTPKTVLALLDELEAAEKQRSAANKVVIQQDIELQELRQRIAELEALTAEQDQRLVDYAAIATKNAAAASEARTLTVNLPPVMRIEEPGLSFNAYGQSGVQNALYEACAAAGIQLKVEE